MPTKDNPTINLHSIVKQRLKEQNKTLAQLCEALNISRQYYGRAMREKTLKLSQLETIAGYLEIPLPELILPAYYEEKETKMIQGNIDFVRGNTFLNTNH